MSRKLEIISLPLGFVSIMTLAALSICRMMAFYPIFDMHGKVSSYKTSIKIVCATWLYSLTLTLPPIFGWGRYVPELSGLGYVSAHKNVITKVKFREIYTIITELVLLLSHF